jgi:hypothetical protein
MLIGLVPFAALGILIGHLIGSDSIGPAMGGIDRVCSAWRGGASWLPDRLGTASCTNNRDPAAVDTGFVQAKPRSRSAGDAWRAPAGSWSGKAVDESCVALAAAWAYRARHEPLLNDRGQTGRCGGGTAGRHARPAGTGPSARRWGRRYGVPGKATRGSRPCGPTRPSTSRSSASRTETSSRSYYFGLVDFGSSTTFETRWTTASRGPQRDNLNGRRASGHRRAAVATGPADYGGPRDVLRCRFPRRRGGRSRRPSSSVGTATMGRRP